MTLKEAYKTLGASKQDDDREIKAKYKKLLILYHPDDYISFPAPVPS